MMIAESPVICRSDSHYAERPVAIVWQGRQLGILAILDRWRTPDGRWFRVVAGDDGIFELFYNEQWDEWSIHQP